MPCLAIQGADLGLGVHFGSEFVCILRVLMHARIDALTRPHFWSLLPSSVFDWVVTFVSISNALTPLDTPLHPVSITSTTLCAVFTGLSPFWLGPMSTVPSVEGLHLQKHITARATHHHPTWQTSHIYTKVSQPRQPKQSSPDYRTSDTTNKNGTIEVNGKIHKLPITKDYILGEYIDIFKGVGTLPGEPFHIRLKEQYRPVKHPPRSVPVDMQLAYKAELNRLVKEGIITEVKEHT